MHTSPSTSGPCAATRGPAHQQGIALLIVLVMLVVIGLLAVTGVEDSQLQTRMAVNSRNFEQSYYNAETSLSIGERALQEGLENGAWELGDFDDSAGLMLALPEEAPPINPLSEADWQANGIDTLDDDDGAVIGAYVIEYLGKVGQPPLNTSNELNAVGTRLDAFRVSAMGLGGGNGASWTVVQSELELGPYF
ncbi:MAG: pilus assembly PilX family protein [Cobetia marina]|jgi:Tfp pilus assembly protein PilX